MTYQLREERSEDVPSIHRLNAAAFETDAEARLVDALRDQGGLVLSIVAEQGGEIIGHIAYSAVRVESHHHTVYGLGLAPMAVRPDQQRRGIGAALIEESLQRLRAAGHRFCVVLGHSDYYPRHGFVRASRHGIRWEKPVPEDVFFVQELTPAGLDGVGGTVFYRPEFDQV